MRPIATLLSAAALLLGAAATPGLAQTTLSFPTWQAEDPSFSPWWNGLIAEFEQKNPGVKVRMNSIPFNQYVNQITVRFAGGNPPDIVHLPTRNFAVFADKGWLEPLDPLMAETDIGKAWNPMQASLTWNGKPQGVLLMGFGYVLFYNKALLEAAGKPVPTTPDELIATAKAITDRDKGVFGFAGVTVEHPNIVPELSSWMLGQGLDPLKDGRYGFTDPAVVRAAGQYREALRLAPPGANSNTARQLFQDGKVAMMIDGPWQYASYSSAGMKDLGLAPVPFPRMVGGSSNSLHVAASTDPQKKKLVTEFIKLAASPKWQEQYTATTSAPAARRDTLSAETLAQKPHLKVVNESAATAVDVFPTPLPVRAAYNEYATLVSKAGMRLLTTETPTDKVMADLQAELERRIPLK